MIKELFQCPYTEKDRSYPFWVSVQRQLESTPYISLNEEERAETKTLERELWIKAMQILAKKGQDNRLDSPFIAITRGQQPEFPDFLGADLIIYLTHAQRPFLLERFGFIPRKVVKIATNLTSVWERKEASLRDLQSLQTNLNNGIYI